MSRVHAEPVGPFASLGERELQAVFQCTQLVEAQRNERVVWQGDPGVAAYVIEAGQVELLAQADGRELSLARLGRGDVFGACALIDGGPHRATARAIGDCRYRRIDRPAFQRLRAEEPLATQKLVRALNETFCHRLTRIDDRIADLLAQEGGRAQSVYAIGFPDEASPAAAPSEASARWAPNGPVPLFGDLDSEELGELVNVLRPMELAEGQSLFAEGAPADGCYFLIDGGLSNMRRVRGREEVLSALAPGAIVGHVSLIDPSPRRFSCVASKDTELLALAAADFACLYGSTSTVGVKIVDRVAVDLAARLRASTDKLTDVAACTTVQARRASLRHAANALLEGRCPTYKGVDLDAISFLGMPGVGRIPG